jgi:hypothetical protein
MRRLNGWQRIGIVLTVIWCVVGGLWIRGLVIDDMGAAATSEYAQCLAARSIQPDGSVPADTDWGPCRKRFDARWQRDVVDRWVEGLIFTVAYTFAPILIVWLVIYVLVAVGRWVAAGFALNRP